MSLRRIAIAIVVIWNVAGAGYVSLVVSEGFSFNNHADKVTALYLSVLLVGFWLLGNILFAVIAVLSTWFRHSIKCPHCTTKP